MKRKRYKQRLQALIKRYGADNIVYFDESGFKAHTGRLSGWAKKGQKLYGDVQGKREKKTNLLMAQRGKELLSPFIFTGACTAKLVTQWVKEMLLKDLKQPSIVIMDNAPVHNKKHLRSLLKQHGHALLPLPPYSPDLNPIEGTFGGMKKRREGMPIETTIENLVMSYSY
jgi:putative transposase